MKLKIEIKHFLTGSILFEYETQRNTFKKTLERAVLRGADLRGADLRGADLRGAYLRGADLRGAYLRGADLTGADLRGADLRGADLRGADLRGAYLRGAYLTGADLTGAYLRGADLTGAYLRGADLRGAYLRGAYLTGAYLRGAKGLKLYWHVHHEILVENLTEPLKNRIAYIKAEKPEEEIKIRLKLLKRVKCKVTELPNTEKGWERLHKKECPKCPWDGKTIFPRK
jgi:hypothetical protein